MVFGNMGDDCATGVAFTRDPSTGEKELLRRIPGQRSGRGRGGRHPHAAADHPHHRSTRRPHGIGPGRRMRHSGAAHARRLSRSSSHPETTSSATIATCRTSSSRSRTWALVDAADPQSGKRTGGGGEDRCRHGEGGADHSREEASDAASIAGERLISCCTPPSTQSREDCESGARPAGVSGCGLSARSCFGRRSRIAPRGGERSSWSASRPARRHSRHARAEGILTARGGMTSRTRPWSRAAWASAASSGCRVRSRSTIRREMTVGGDV